MSGGSGGQSGMSGGGMQGSRQGGERMRRSDVGMVWIKEGEKIRGQRIHIGLSDGLNTEVTGKIKEGDEIITGMTSSQPAQAAQAGQQQQQNPFAPQMPRGAGGRGGR